MKKHKKKIIIIGVSIMLLLVCIVPFVVLHLSYVDVNDDERIIEFVEKYVGDMHIHIGNDDEVEKSEDIEIVSTSDIVKDEELGVLAVLVKYKCAEGEKIKCVYLARNKWFDNLYEVQGAIGATEGEIVASSQDVNDINVAFIRGMDIPENITEYYVEELDYAGKVKNGWCLEMMQTEELTHFVVDTN